MIVLGALIAGLAVGLRTQTLWLTAPLLTLVLVDRIGRGVAGAIMGAAMTFTIGALAWGVPLLMASGGLQGYLSALGTQAGEDFAGGEMLYLNPGAAAAGLRAAAHVRGPLGMDAARSDRAGAGCARRRVPPAPRPRGRSRPSWRWPCRIRIFHLLFQDTSFTRYALPLVPVVAWLAVKGARSLSPRAVDACGRGAVLGRGRGRHADADRIRRVARAGRAGRPGAQCRGRQRRARGAGHAPDIPSARSRPRLVGVHPQLPSPPRREWLELAKYWTEGHDGVVWFLADPRRTDLALVDPQSRRDVTAFRWGPSARPTFGGMRPAGLDWVRIATAGWFAEEGWALTPETAGMARLMGRGPHLGPITARVRRDRRGAAC